MTMQANGTNGEEKKGVTYWDYVRLDDLLSLQQPHTEAHDELQFIMVHQTFEIWFKLAINELRAAIEHLRAGELAGGNNLLKRVATILRTAVKGFDPLVTMSMQGYAEFRDALVPASGFQSMQFRVIEMLMGMEPEGEGETKKFYWEGAVQAGETFHQFMGKYQDELLGQFRELEGETLRRVMLRMTEKVTGKKGADAYEELLRRRNSFPEYVALAETARDLQQAMLDFRLGHHKVTVFTIGKHAAGTSDSHAADHPSCAEYLLGVIRDRSVIFPELEEGMNG